MPSEGSTPAMTNKKYKIKLLKREATFSLRQLIICGLIFGAIGGYVLWKALAAGPVVASLEAERMSLPAGATIVSDTSASGGQAVQLKQSGSLNSPVSLPSQATSVTVNARATAQRCKGNWPSISLSIDGQTVFSNTTVGSTSWTGYSASTNLSAATHTVAINYTKTSTFTKCNQALYLDVSIFYGPAPPPTPSPTVSLSASPTSVTAGGSSTLTWSSTNATSCTASGAWSGSKALSGSASTGALNATTTYTLTCSNSAGSASASATVSVTAVSPPPPSSGIPKYGTANGARFTYSENSSQQSFDMSKELDLHAKIMRVDCGGFGSQAQTALSLIMAKGLVPICVLGSTPNYPWGTSAATFGNQCSAAASYMRNAPQAMVEALNEPDLHGWTADTYLPYLKTCYQAAKQANPNIIVLHAGMWKGSHANSCGCEDYFLPDWAARIAALGGANYMDFFNVHAYGSFYDGWSSIMDLVWGSNGKGYYDTRNVRTNLNNAGLSKLPIVITESGGGNNPQGITDSFSTVDGVGTGYRKTLFSLIYNLRDDEVAGYGMLDANLQPRQGYNTFQNYTTSHGQ